MAMLSAFAAYLVRFAMIRLSDSMTGANAQSDFGWREIGTC